MVRGLPYSIVIHVITMVIVFVYGSYVSKPVIRPERVFRVRIAQAPAQKTTVPEQPPVEQPEPKIEPPKPQPETPPKLEPKQLPEKPKDSPKPKAVEKQPEIAKPVEPETKIDDSQPMVTAPAGPSVSATDQPFEFAWYLEMLKGRISRNWNPRQLGFRESSSRACVVHFQIDRSGNISQVTISRSSGISLFDRESLRAVQAAHGLPPLPGKYTARSLGVSIVFTLESGL